VDIKKILVFGLPGSGKTTFTKKLVNNMDVAYFNADEIRRIFHDWDFSKEGRIRQVKRMEKLCSMTNKTSVVEFVCPFNKYRKGYDIMIWMDTIELSRFEDTNQMFEKPDLTESLIHIKDYNYDDVIKTIVPELK
jgi:adenylylsulfate kinase